MASATAQVWMDRVAARWPVSDVRGTEPCVLDLGCGTGRFAPLLAERLAARVVGIDPSEKMLRVACRENAHPRVGYALGEATRLPLRDASVALAWLSMVVHHFPDRAAAARELRRVVAPGGVVLVRGCFRGRIPQLLMYRYFPSALAADEARLPSLDDLRLTFETAGFAWVGLEEVPHVLDPDFAAYVERSRLRAASSFDFVPDDEFAAGIRAMEKAAARGDHPGPVTERIDLLTFARATD